MSLRHAEQVLRARWRRTGYLDFPVWIPLFMDGCALLFTFLAVVQRDEVLLPLVIALVMLVPVFVEFAGYKPSWIIPTVFALGGAGALIVLYPVGQFDFAYLIPVMFAGHIASIETMRRGAIAAGLAAALIIVLDVIGRLDGAAFWVLLVLLGWDIGFIMQYQQRRFEEQEAAHAAREAQAAVEERQRIAREVHDVIAHSLSVTMLHLTAARRALEEDGHSDVEEAVEALRDAEQMGRDSMTEIRRTVGLLDSGESRLSPEPGTGDIAELIGDFRSAGLDVSYEQRGDPAAVSPTTGLTLYRIMQESLANVAKHAPEAQVRAQLNLVGDPRRLTVWNSLNGVAAPREDSGGSGIPGMRERTELLGGSFTAGRSGAGWLVEVEFPGEQSAADDVSLKQHLLDKLRHGPECKKQMLKEKLTQHRPTNAGEA